MAKGKVFNTGDHVIVGDGYSKPLDYEGLVGSECVVVRSMSALCSVVVISGEMSKIGQEVDIHIEDCIPVQEGERNSYSVIVDMQTGHILYSKDIEYMDYLKMTFVAHRMKFFENISQIHTVLDWCLSDLTRVFDESRKQDSSFDWIPYSLDDRNPVSDKYQLQYQKYLVFEKKRKADELTSSSRETDSSPYGRLMPANPEIGFIRPAPPIRESHVTKSSEDVKEEPKVEPNQKLTQDLLSQIDKQASDRIKEYDERLKQEKSEQDRQEMQERLANEFRKQQAEQDAQRRKEMDEIVAKERQAEKEQLNPTIGLNEDDSDKVDGNPDTDSGISFSIEPRKKENPRPWWLRKILGND